MQPASRKWMEDGVLRIEHNGRVYDAQGNVLKDKQ